MPIYVRDKSGKLSRAHLRGGWATLKDHNVFLIALEGNDGDTLQWLALLLRGSLQKMPDRACASAGVPLGSTYGEAVRVMFPDLTLEWL